MVALLLLTSGKPLDNLKVKEPIVSDLFKVNPTISRDLIFFGEEQDISFDETLVNEYDNHYDTVYPYVEKDKILLIPNKYVVDTPEQWEPYTKCYVDSSGTNVDDEDHALKYYNDGKTLSFSDRVVGTSEIGGIVYYNDPYESPGVYQTKIVAWVKVDSDFSNDLASLQIRVLMDDCRYSSWQNIVPENDPIEEDFIGDRQKERNQRYTEEDSLIKTQRDNEHKGLEGQTLKEKEKQYRKEDKERENKRKKEEYDEDHSYRTCLGWFQRNYCAHLFLTDFEWVIGDKISRYPVAKYRDEFETIKGYYEEYRTNQKNKIPVKIENKITHFSADDIIQAAKDYKEFLEEVQNETDENYLEKVELFTNQDLVERYKVLWDNFLAGSAYTKYLARCCIIKDEYIKALNKEKREYNKEHKQEDKKKLEIKSVIDPLFGVMAFAYANKYNKASAGLIKALTEENCLTKPFVKDREKQKEMKEEHRIYRKILPLDLCSVMHTTGFQLVGWKTEIDDETRKKITDWSPMNKKEVSNALRAGKQIYLKIPLYIGEEWDEEDLNIKYKANTKIKRPYLWFQFLPSPKIRYCLSMGVNIQSLRIMSPRGASQKIIIQVMMSAIDTDPFIHSSKFITHWNTSDETKHKKFQTQLKDFGNVKTLASDINKLSRYMTALSTQERQLNLMERLAEWDLVFRRLESIRKFHLPKIQQKMEIRISSIHMLQSRL
jgi:hypothetical protein